MCHLYTAYITVLLIVDSDDDVIVTGVNKVKEDPDAVIFVASSKVKRNRKGNTALLLSVPSKGNQIQSVMQFCDSGLCLVLHMFISLRINARLSLFSPCTSTPM